MQYDLPEAIASRIQHLVNAGEQSLVFSTIERALDEILEAKGITDVYERLKSCSGTVPGWTVEEMLADRRRGLD